MEVKVRDFIKHNNLLVTGDRVVVAVSGGPDSMCLLYLLYRLRAEFGIELHVVHVNHHLRGSESDAEAEFVRYFAQGLGLEVTICHVDVKKAHAISKGSKQEVARDLRYQALYRILAEWQGNKIAVAHNAEDQAETILLHIIRGTGIEGLVGMSACIGQLIRPLLATSRLEILTYLKDWKVDYCIDSSNNETVYSRNQLRLQIFPLLQNINANVIRSINRLGDLARADEDYMSTQALALWDQAVKDTNTGILLKAEFAKNIHPALFSRLCRLIWKHLRGSNKNLEHIHLDIVKRLLVGRTGAEIALPGSIRVERTYDGLLWHVTQETGEEAAETKWQNNRVYLPIGEPINIPWNQRTMIIEQGILIDENSELGENELILNPEEIKLPLCIRFRQAGDRIRPQGGGGSKKLKEFLIDCKIPRQDRDKLPLLVDASGQVLWILGVRKGCPKNKVKIGHHYYRVSLLQN